MKQRRRIHYTESQKAQMWERRQKGESLSQIAQLFDRGHSSIQGVLAESGRIRPAPRCRSKMTPTLAEREEISRSMMAGHSILCGTSLGAMAMKPGSTVEVVIEGIGRLVNEYHAVD